MKMEGMPNEKTLKQTQEGMLTHRQIADDEIREEAYVAGKASAEAEVEKIKAKLGKQTKGNKENEKVAKPVISAEWHGKNSKGKEVKETITMDIEKYLEKFISFYEETGVVLPPEFEETIRDIWEENQTEIQKDIEQNGFDSLLMVPGNIPLAELAEKMKMKNGYSFYNVNGDFSNVKSQGVGEPRIILYHNATLPEIQEKYGIDVHLNITGGDAEKLFEKNPNNYLRTLPDALVLERSSTKGEKHLSDWTKRSGQWLPGSKAGARLVRSGWLPGFDWLSVNAFGPGSHVGRLGLRPSRSYFQKK